MFTAKTGMLKLTPYMGVVTYGYQIEYQHVTHGAIKRFRSHNSNVVQHLAGNVTAREASLSEGHARYKATL